MEALRIAAAPQALCCFESSSLGVSLGVRKSTLSGLSSASSSSCGVPVGLSGDGLTCVRRSASRLCFSASSSSASSSSASSSSSPRPRLSRRVSRLTPPPRSTAAAAAPAPAQSLDLEGESSLLKDIDSQDLEAETPSLLQQCSDLDWKKLVNDLRSEALDGLQSSGLRALSLKALEKLMESWIHDEMVEDLECVTAAGKVLAAEETGWSLQGAATELRMEANFQAAQMLASGVDSTFDWETDVAELHQRILLQGGAEPSVLRAEHRLRPAWTHAQDQMVQTSNKQAEEALSTTSISGHEESLNSKPQGEAVRNSSHSNSSEKKEGKFFLSLGAAVATGIAVEGIWLMDAIASEANPEALEAASRAPSWLVPAVLTFPPLSYFLFNVYRDRVNPYAKVTDWMFGVVALTIVSNLVMMAVWGVRLY